MATLSSEKYKLKNGKSVTAYRVVIKRKKKRSQTIRLGAISKQQAARCLKLHNALSLFDTGRPVSVKPWGRLACGRGARQALVTA